MLKNILKLEGAQKLTKNEQKSINGGLSLKDNCRWLNCGETGVFINNIGECFCR